jgi:nitroimidazol reductase NimA-like FMN-containing flavoprotein (pyridoxamine 5'-phosphate oxidase superfamily)
VGAVIERDACLGLLSGATFGRMALTVDALPRIVPVRFAVHRDRINAYVHGADEVAKALDAAVVAFQADGYDNDIHQVWSVHVVGRVTAHHDSAFVISPDLVEGQWLPF